MTSTTYNFEFRDVNAGKLCVQVKTTPDGSLVSMSKVRSREVVSIAGCIAKGRALSSFHQSPTSTSQWYKEPPPPLDEGQLREAGEIYCPRVVEFCEQHEGDVVGDGECWTLAAEALKAAGARPARSYNFGQEIDASQVGQGRN